MPGPTPEELKLMKVSQELVDIVMKHPPAIGFAALRETHAMFLAAGGETKKLDVEAELKVFGDRVRQILSEEAGEPTFGRVR
jgi:hypothetical protein